MNFAACCRFSSVLLCLAALLSPLPLSAQNDIIARADVAPVWSGHPVGFALLTHKGRQFVAYFRQFDNNGTIEHRLSLAQRTLGSDSWTFNHTTQTTPWDTHNYLTMTVDDDDYIHVSGNMHGDPLRYYRSPQPMDITGIDVSQSTPMVGSEETAVTYPQFLRDPSGRLIFTYRDGAAGDGDNYYNVYDHATQTWSRLLPTSLLDGEGVRNAYPWGPVLGPDGFMHLVWVWREDPGSENTHSVCYMKSPDMENWYAADGTPLTLPITSGNPDVMVDPVPLQQGLINGCTKIGFDSQNRAVITYHKFESYTDPTAATQIFNARFEAGAWQIYQTSDWNYRWDFSGGGSFDFDVRTNPVELDSEGNLKQIATNVVEGSFEWTLNEADLSILSSDTPTRTINPALVERQNIFPGVAQGGGYIHTPDSGLAVGVLTLPFTVDTAGEYHVWARVRGVEGNLLLTDSFHVRMDNGLRFDWHNLAQSAWAWRKVTSGATRNPVSFNLTAGAHELHFETREAGAEVDMVAISTDAGFQPVNPEPSALGGQYVGTLYEDDDTGSVSWSVNVPSAGEYVLWARTRAQPGLVGTSDSYFVRINNSSEALYSIPPYSFWVWGKVKDGSTVRSYVLSAGSHTVRFRTREAGAELDMLALAPAGDDKAPLLVWQAEDGPTLDGPPAVYAENPADPNGFYLEAEDGSWTAPMRRELDAVDSNEMTVRIATDLNGSEYPDKRWLLRWETLGPNRDYARPEPWPEPTMMEVYLLGTDGPDSCVGSDFDLYR